MRNRTLLIIAVVLFGAWYVMRSGVSGSASLPWNRGQAGTIFQSGHAGGGQ